MTGKLATVGAALALTLPLSLLGIIVYWWAVFLTS
jgi:hypothetical protein